MSLQHVGSAELSRGGFVQMFMLVAVAVMLAVSSLFALVIMAFPACRCKNAPQTLPRSPENVPARPVAEEPTS